MALFLLILSVAPSVAILLYLYKKDKYEQEPLDLLLMSFGMGVLSVFAVLLSVGIFIGEPDTGNRFLDAFINAFFRAAIPEEGFKFLFLYLLIWNNENFNERFDGILYAVFVSLGFATVENIMYVITGGVSVALLRAITAVPAHALFAVAMGYYFSYAKFIPEQKTKYLVLSITTAIILHGLYDLFLFLGESYASTHPAFTGLMFIAFVVFVAFLWIQGLKKIKKMSADFYFSGVPQQEANEYMLQEYWQMNDALSHAQPDNGEASYLIGWYETNRQLFVMERDAILQEFPDAELNIEDGIVKFLINMQTITGSWTIQLVYARNYRNLPEQLRIYFVMPDLGSEVKGLPYIKKDLSDSYYLDVAPAADASGVAAVNNALLWIIMFEQWVNEEIEIKNFVIE